MAENRQALGLGHVLGISQDVQNNLVNLSDGVNHRVCYAAAHTLVILDTITRSQRFLQGHKSSITCLAATYDHSIIASADSGPDSMIVFWNCATGNPIRILNHPHAYGVCAMEISQDGAYMATVSAVAPDSGLQEVALWDFRQLRRAEAMQPIVLGVVPPGDAQTTVKINPSKDGELMTNGRRRVYFWQSQLPIANTFKYYSPPLRSKDFKQAIADFVTSSFVPGTAQALTSTLDGDVVVWDEQGLVATPGTSPSDRRASKVMKLHSAAINVLTTIQEYVVTGSEDGCMRLFDPLLRIVAWFEDMKAGGLLAISFGTGVHPDFAPANALGVPDFAVATTSGKVVAMRAAAFEEAHPEQRRGEVTMESTPQNVADLATHPSASEFAVLSTSGLLERWDFASNTRLASRQLGEGYSGTVVNYSKDGTLMFVAFAAGHMQILHAHNLELMYESRNTGNRVTLIASSPDSKRLALADSAHQVLLYGWVQYKGDNYRWDFIGKMLSHHSKIVGLCFGTAPSGQMRLFSTDAAGYVGDYDLENSTLLEGLQIAHHCQVPGPSEAVAGATCFAPPMPYFVNSSSQTLLLVADDMFKLRLFDADERHCAATYLGPTFGGAITRLTVFRSTAQAERFMVAYATADQVVGLLDWPLTGHPDNVMGVIAHPGAIAAMAVSCDGRHLFTVGADGIVNCWDVAPGALGRAASPNGKHVPPQDGGTWAEVLDDPQLIADLKDFFYYAQLQAQGEDSVAPRNITGRVPVSAIANIFRAVGDYPSQDEVQNLMDHIDFVSGADPGATAAVDFATFLGLYVNHRRVAAVQQEDIDGAFLELADVGGGGLSRAKLLELLAKQGDGMPAKELAELLQVLTGAGDVQALPDVLDAQAFSQDVLGFE